MVLTEGGRCRFLLLLITDCLSSLSGWPQERLECPRCHSLSLGGCREAANAAARCPPKLREREMLIRSGVNCRAALQAGTRAAPAAGQGLLEDAGPQGSRGIAPLGLGMFFPVTEPRSACPGLGLPRSSLLITGPIFC